MSEPKAKANTVGALIEVAEGATVIRPDGVASIVTGGLYVLDVPGTFVVDGIKVSVP